MKKIISVGLAVVLILSMSIASLGAEEKSLLVLGDSISTGFGLKDYKPLEKPYSPESFATIVGEGMSVKNLGVDGMTSLELLELVKAMVQDKEADNYIALAQADIITITIGGNDFLLPLISEVCKAFAVDVADKDWVTKLEQNVKAEMSANKTLAGMKIMSSLNRIIEGSDLLLKNYEENFTQILKILRENTKENTKIIVQTLFNPYDGIAFLGTAIEKPLMGLNQIIFKYSGTLNYNICNTYTIFKDSEVKVTNASEAAMNLDPHPNKEGHSLIAKEILHILSPEYPISKLESRVSLLLCDILRSGAILDSLGK